MSHHDRAKWEKRGFVLLAALALAVVILVGIAFLKPGRTIADDQASAEAVAHMDQAQAQDRAARREAEKAQRSEFN
ncbi:hypothetical protein [Brevundimonas sp. M20]|uniref:hypothetical protein n=1 Tax=Brevundimonas sp. M20 TaxID=2591463 RepID=UPI001146A227|nr:hypothetical protein [Brevundimonas sp. M20]QDH72189.1 hypothetical protein FKQ52_01390 [Brevundimonas sp. M20]